ncbi:hypothetical protein Cgig2_004703 [Carnegiea gigantea]|uniref:Uncharacterized protein n=1 Tax=Carnegiea gigantea TaxID=171969 RepID=A0A9Q1GQ63_9CARY|nr:hypothetical protein Cgig2_004703 [Carnegiea gigantea]
MNPSARLADFLVAGGAGLSLGKLISLSSEERTLSRSSEPFTDLMVWRRLKRVEEDPSSYQILHHDIEFGHRPRARLTLQGKFTYKPLYWEWLEENRTPHLRILSAVINDEVHGCSNREVIFDELLVVEGQHTETFLLCTFILPVRVTGCIYPGTFNIASFMASGTVYCLPMAILTSIYKGINEISCSSHLGRSGGNLPTYFLYAWFVGNFVRKSLMVRPPTVRAW